jgi:hypothetical protein
MPAPLTVTRIRPRENAAIAMSRNTDFGAQSTITSQQAATSSIDINQPVLTGFAMLASALSRRPDAIATNDMPLMPSSSAFATTLPMVPRPIIPTDSIFFPKAFGRAFNDQKQDYLTNLY